MSERVAALDIGSNSIKILVARHGEAIGTIEVLHEKTHETRISTGIAGQPPRLLPTSIEAGEAAVRELWTNAATFNFGAASVVATSAVRTAVNGQEFADRIAQITGVPLRILSGDEEAAIIAAGIRTDPSVKKVFPDATLFDLGGGSLELIRMVSNRVHQQISLPLGAVRLTEALVRNSHAPVPDSLQLDVIDHVRHQLHESGFVFSKALIGSSGGLAVIRHLLARNSGNPMAASSHLISRDYLESLCSRVCRQTFEERIHLSGLPQARADIFPVALLVFQALLHLADASHIHHTTHNLRYGLAAQLLGISHES